MRRRPIRRAQLIAPFGPGAMIVAPDGTSLIAAGLDHWFEHPSKDDHREIDPGEFRFGEWRLERKLGVDHFREPPDYREAPMLPGQQVPPNVGLTIPYLRFPEWHSCPKCSRLERFPSTMKDPPRCSACGAKAEAKGYKPPRMVQVRFIALCEDGHIQDFPWREWVHKDARPTCGLPMKLRAGASTSLGAVRITCDCGVSRNLERITEADPPISSRSNGDGEDGDDPARPSTHLTRALAPGHPYLCQGRRPWLGEDGMEGGCPRSLRGALRGATNVYYAATRSAIYMPRGDDNVPSDLIRVLEEPALKGTLSLLAQLGQTPTPGLLKTQHELLLRDFSNAQIIEALHRLSEGDTAEEIPLHGDDPETSFRRAEYAALRVERIDGQLQTRPVPRDRYADDVARYFAGITLVEKLRETRVLTGFARVHAEDHRTIEERKAMLWRRPPTGSNRWLPGYRVFGEGIYLELDGALLRNWERQTEVTKRAERLETQFLRVQARRGLPGHPVSPRLVLVHTIAHLLMNQLVFDCGYSSASLRERLYVSTHPEAPMAGVLIYTASGDAEGTMGGLVRMGKPGYLEPVVRGAIQNAQWCSADPVCMELGGGGGQGPDSCNLAACHNCALVPETSCEQFNRFLDRWLVVGDIVDHAHGFLAGLA